MITTIMYLNPEGSADIIGPLSKVIDDVQKHPLTIEYILEEFIIAFNRGEISHLGYVAVKEESQ